MPRLRLLLALACATALAACGKHQPTVRQDADTFLRNNGKAPGVTTLADGLQYKVLRSGPADGPHPARGDEVKLNYAGSLIDGQVFDSTLASGQPAVMKLDGLVQGWMEALPKMRPGDEWLLYVPPKLGYGAEGRPPVIPPNSVLVFDITLLGVLKTGAVQYGAIGQPVGRQHG
jgi:FKBP-type peptidyl-prolyl cis-trans isomerase